MASLSVLPVCASMLFCAGAASSSPFRAPARLVPSCPGCVPSAAPRTPCWPSAAPPTTKLTARAIPVMTKRNDPLACCSMAFSSSSDVSVERLLLLELKNDSGLNADALHGGAVLDLRVIAPAGDRLQGRVVE